MNQIGRTVRGLVLSALCLSIWLLGGGMDSVNAAVTPQTTNTGEYVTADGRDITAIVECLPKQLSEANLDRAIAESGQDFLEWVFQLKDDYSEYKLTEAGQEFDQCLRAKGILPAAAQLR
ncbi:hypothetical protein [Vacuolonema iberomarrocanum]|uniref:hypothetical protein n=1 Tax=Vacuolonema iberomarrocanum TaxID=3454632 RepID=UPI0019E0BE76|nr:hypothetical protein [filamentous cyanobacterium LEGE 07170]